MISTKDYSLLPDRKSLQSICKAISVLDAIISLDWEYRYYSYNSKWGNNEQCFQMHNGSGDEMHILFREDGCVINGFAHEYEQQNKEQLIQHLPSIFNEFIFGEPVNSIGTTFCLWTSEFQGWQVGQIKSYNDGSEKMLFIFDGKSQTYIDWATEYFEKDNIPLKIVTEIYNKQTLSKEMVLSIVDEVEDWEQLINDLAEIDYPYDFE
jgi:hypothetical protein